MHFLRLVLAIALAGPLMSCGQGPQGPMGNVGPPGPPGPNGDPGPDGRCPVGRTQGGVVECLRNLARRTICRKLRASHISAFLSAMSTVVRNSTPRLWAANS